ncbi:hypothetical protein IFM89_001901 [Coptis chinensis]|uniref:Tetratricopeptide repeat protein n=1 Tax=Coptis chinensis TaxID=261450 RepID=A0A835IGG4_9MAGN|nr:hypothetical protein IFM89_001901 [Coptis chinensis]
MKMVLFNLSPAQTAYDLTTKAGPDAIYANPFDKFLLSKRSICWALTKEGDKALEDALKCVELDHEWAEAHYREGVAWCTLQKFDKAVVAFRQGMELNPDNEELRNAFQRACQADLADAI